MRRNPYFYAVDETGQQLPYLDEIQYQKGPSGTGRTLCVMAGGCDQDNLENPSVFVEALKKASEPNSPNKITWGPETLGYWVAINQSADLGVKDDRDKAVRELFRDVKFRRALSQAMDRDGITQAIMTRPVPARVARRHLPRLAGVRPEICGVLSLRRGHRQGAAGRAGLQGYRQQRHPELDHRPAVRSGSDPLACAPARTPSRPSTSARRWSTSGAKSGIKINLRPTSSQTATDQDQSGEWDMYVYRGGQAYRPAVHSSAPDRAPDEDCPRLASRRRQAAAAPAVRGGARSRSSRSTAPSPIRPSARR